MYRRSPRALHRRVGPDVLVLGPGSDEFRVLSGGAVVIWAALREPWEEEDLAAELAEVLSADATRVRSDVHACIRELLADGLIEEVA